MYAYRGTNDFVFEWYLQCISFGQIFTSSGALCWTCNLEIRFFCGKINVKLIKGYGCSALPQEVVRYVGLMWDP